MTTFDLIEQLSKKSKNEIQYALLIILQEQKLDFIDIVIAYTRYLENLSKQQLNKLIEAETCVLESLIYDSIPVKEPQIEASVQRRLYLLNQSKRFNTKSLNEEFKYDEERAKKYNHEND